MEMVRDISIIDIIDYSIQVILYPCFVFSTLTGPSVIFALSLFLLEERWDISLKSMNLLQLFKSKAVYEATLLFLV
jgi:hypothetical protein